MSHREHRGPRARGAHLLLSVISVISVAFVPLLLAGCAAGESRQEGDLRRALETDIQGRWTGDPVGPPPEVWFEHAKFDLEFTDQGEFSALVSTYAKHPYELRFTGEYSVKHSDTVVIHDNPPNLGGKWDVRRGGAPGELVLSRGDITIALRKRYGT